MRECEIPLNNVQVACVLFAIVSVLKKPKVTKTSGAFWADGILYKNLTSLSAKLKDCSAVYHGGAHIFTVPAGLGKSRIIAAICAGLQ